MFFSIKTCINIVSSITFSKSMNCFKQLSHLNIFTSWLWLSDIYKICDELSSFTQTFVKSPRNRYVITKCYRCRVLKMAWVYGWPFCEKLKFIESRRSSFHFFAVTLSFVGRVISALLHFRGHFFNFSWSSTLFFHHFFLYGNNYTKIKTNRLEVSR